MEPVIDTLPIAVRGWCIRDPKTSRKRKANSDNQRAKKRGNRKPNFDNRRPSGFVCIGDPPQGTASLLGVILFGVTAGWRITQETLVYPNSIGPEELKTIEQYVRERTRDKTILGDDDEPKQCSVWADEPDIVVSLISLLDFQKKFWAHAYKWRKLVIGFDLPRGLARLSNKSDEVTRGDFVGHWSFEMLPQLKHSTGRLNRILIKKADRYTNLKFSRFGVKKNDGQKSYYSGEFLNLQSLIYGLTSERDYTLASAIAAFTGEIADCPEHAIDHQRRLARYTLSLAETLIGLFDISPVSRANGGRLSETWLHSPAGHTRVLAQSIGLGAAEIRRDRIGPSSEAFNGGLAETPFRGAPPVISTDYSKQYATIAVHIGLQKFLAAERIDFMEATDEARELASSLSIADLLRPAETFPKLAMLCWVEPDGEILPTKGFFEPEGGRSSFGMVFRYGNGTPVPLFLPDVIAAKVMGGKAPKILKAERMVPVGKRKLTKIKLPSGAWLDPDTKDIFVTLVEEGERLRLGQGDWANVSQVVREILYPGWKAGNNGLAFGSLAQTNQVDLSSGTRETVTLLYDDGEIRRPVLHPEDPGKLVCVPLAALVTSCGHLLQAMVHRMVMDKGGIVAMGDTDSSHIIATETGGTVLLDNHDDLGRKKVSVHALSKSDVYEIADRLAPLNPFDPELMPGSPLKIKGGGLALIIADKRYCIFDSEGTPDGMASVLGMYLPPVEDFITKAWLYEAGNWGLKTRSLGDCSWVRFPAVRMLQASSPKDWEPVAKVVTWPFDPFLAMQVIGAKPGEERRTAVAIAPFEANPEKWAGLPWIFAASGEPVTFEKAGADEYTWHYATIKRLLDSYAKGHPHDFLDPDGSPCRWNTRGILRRRPIKDGKKWITTKERLTLSSLLDNPFSLDRPEAFRADGLPSHGAGPGNDCGDWNSVRSAIPVVGTAALAELVGKDPQSIRNWLDGDIQPYDQRKVMNALVELARDAGLGMPDDTNLDRMCADLPARAFKVEWFAAVMAAALVMRFGSVRKVAEEMGVVRNRVSRWLTQGGELRPIVETNAIIAELAEFAKMEFGRTQRRIELERGDQANRQAILALFAPDATGPEILTPTETLDFPICCLVMAMIAVIATALAPIFERWTGRQSIAIGHHS